MSALGNGYINPVALAEAGNAFKQVFKQVYNNNNNNNGLSLYATFYDGLRQMVINERIYESAKTQKWVKIGKIL